MILTQDIDFYVKYLHKHIFLSLEKYNQNKSYNLKVIELIIRVFDLVQVPSKY